MDNEITLIEDYHWLTQWLILELTKLGDVEHTARCRRILLAMGKPAPGLNDYELRYFNKL